MYVLQGGEGGGHTGEIPTSMLIPAVGRDSISCILFADSGSVRVRVRVSVGV